MKVKALYSSLKEHFERNFWIYMIVVLSISTGMVLGIYSVKYMGETEQVDIVTYFESFINSIVNTDVNGQLVLIQTIQNNIPLILLICIFGLTIIGIPIVLIIDVIKGFTLGFTFSFIIKGIGIKGVGVSIIGLMPQNIIYIPCIVIASVISIESSLIRLKSKVNKNNLGMQRDVKRKYMLSYLIILLVMFIGFIYEAYISPGIVKILVSSIGGTFQ